MKKTKNIKRKYMEPRDYTRLTQNRNGKWLYKDETEKIIGAAMEVYRELVSGFLGYVYKEALSYELMLRKISFERQFRDKKENLVKICEILWLIEFTGGGN